MNLGYIRELVNYRATKENKGNTITPEQFSLRLRDACIDFANKEYKFFGTDQKNTDVLGVIEKVRGGNFNPLFVDSNGLSEIPSDYYRASSMSCYIDGNYKQVDILSDAEFRDRKGSYIIKPAEHPYCVIRRNKFQMQSTYPYGYIEFMPKTITYAEFTYLMQVPTPVYDYVIGSTTYEEVYMPVGSIITATNNLISSTGSLLYTGVTHTPSITLPYTSQSVELIFPEDTHLEIASIILSYIGINLRDKELFELNEFIKQREDAGR